MEHSAMDTTFTVPEDIVVFKKLTVWGKQEKVCQTCRHHKNKPSRCLKKNGFVGRKESACEEHKAMTNNIVKRRQYE